MILENTYCKGNWLDKPVETFTIDLTTDQVTSTIENKTDASVYTNCIIQDRKNWTCESTSLQKNISVIDGLINFGEKSDTRQITRLEWLQYKILEIIN